MEEAVVKIIDTVNGGGTVTTYDVGRMLEAAGKVLKETKLSCLRTAEAFALDTAQDVAKKVAEALAQIATLEASVFDAETAAVKRIDEAFKTYREARNRLEQRIANMSEIHTGIPLYELTKLVELANAVGNMSDAAWERMLTLAGTLAATRQEPTP